MTVTQTPCPIATRYGEALPGTAARNPVIDSLLSHRTVRNFLPQPLAAGTIELLVAAASSAPTSSNLQVWSVVAVQDAATRAKLADLAGGQKHIAQAPLCFLWVADLARAESILQAEGSGTEALDHTEAFVLATVDAMLAAQNALVAAESLGLGTVYIGGLRNHPAELAELVGLPKRAYVVAGLVVGHPDPEVATAVKPRLPQEAVLHHERYNSDQGAAIARHNEATLAFRASQGLSPQPWTDLLKGRLGSLRGLSGRHVLRNVLENLGLGFR
ncbi:NADPH-dependent oxidoreductase [Falsigemmobacter intermedius]|uniref:NADPH-dependent oxidoreductase n=1 Tax=Falsigemmobacter intermedius TaxID=1553448 RepID=A0A3S3UEK8_9RHOB|nr:NADPH-dependent oxidoreductase [Falsigemmobacter intermedius]RWY40051.1 NADPH-dependent oxidoreductase [Falsigemmobacter intermedius]